MIEAIVTTFDALLKISVDLARQEVASQVIDEACGIYFGLTRCGSKIFLAARNLDINRIVKSRGIPTNMIYSFDSERCKIRPVISHECLKDLHQIRTIGRWLCVVLGDGSKIVVFERESWQMTREINLSSHVPSHLCHEGGPPGHETDYYHFNSVFFKKDRAFVLAHNWNHGSFVIEFSCSFDRLGPCDFRFVRAYEQLGFEAHDVIFHGSTLYVLDSRNGKLIRRGATQDSFCLPNEGGRPFPRGLSLTRDHVIICYGYWSTERADRSTSDTRLCVLDRRSLRQIMDSRIGSYGNSCDIIVTSERDMSDQPHIGFGWNNLFSFLKVRGKRL